MGTERLCLPHANQSGTDLLAGEQRDFIWRPLLGTPGSLAVPPSFWEAAAYCFGGNNSRARLSMSDASCMPLGDPGKVHSSLGKCSLDHLFLLMPPAQPKSGINCQVQQLEALLEYLLMTFDVLIETLYSSESTTQAKRSIFSIVPTSVEIHLHPCTPSFQPFELSPPFPSIIRSKPAVGMLSAPSCPLL